jgi:hypothetical protein
MTTWNGAALSVAMVLFAVCAIAAPAAAEPAIAKDKPPLQAADVSAHRRMHHYRHYAYRAYPIYYGRPVTYAPAPFIPIPPLWGYGWEWW